MTTAIPVPPTDWELAQVTYSVTSSLAQSGLSASSPFSFIGGDAPVSTAIQLGNSGQLFPPLIFTFSFATPGSLGTFDQAAVEADIAATVTGFLTALAVISGLALAGLQEAVTVNRSWMFYSAADSGNNSTYNDTMAYPGT
jgi:hypothetical protein